ncbi:hypothetical protein, partial [Thauera aminoaromatica]|uniref:hypothetical protein n=1 Tax=Thauera aminoaromatica TaxID=164330 RepID=UPI0035B06267
LSRPMWSLPSWRWSLLLAAVFSLGAATALALDREPGQLEAADAVQWCGESAARPSDLPPL